MHASPKMKWFVLLFTFVFAIGMNSFRNSFQFFMLPMADTFHADRSLISVSVSIFMITTGIVQFFVGFFIDRFSVRKIMALGAVCVSVSFLVLPYSPNVHVFSAIYGVLGGIGYSCAVGVTTQYFISRWFDTHKPGARYFDQCQLSGPAAALAHLGRGSVSCRLAKHLYDIGHRHGCCSAAAPCLRDEAPATCASAVSEKIL